MEPEAFLSLLRTRLPADLVGPDARETTLLLDLARVAAHRSERWAAPISTYLAGLSLAGRAADERIAVLGAVVAALDERDDEPDGR